MKKPTLNGDMEYDLPKILDEQITPGSMYIKESNAVVQDVKAVGCGAYHTLLICIGDMFYACGLNNYGQLGETVRS